MGQPNLTRSVYSPMKRFTILLAVIVTLLGTSCSGVYWEQKKRTAHGTYRYYRPAWGHQVNCPTYNQLPTKPSTFKRLTYWTK